MGPGKKALTQAAGGGPEGSIEGGRPNACEPSLEGARVGGTNTREKTTKKKRENVKGNATIRGETTRLEGVSEGNRRIARRLPGREKTS